MNSDISTVFWFLEGYSDASENRNFYEIKSSLETSIIYYLLKRTRKNIIIKKSQNGYSLEIVNRVSSCKVKSVRQINNTSEYVYDIETVQGRFQAGIGELIVKNTDSCMIKFNTEASKKFDSEYERIHSQVVVTEKNKIYLDNLKQQAIKEAICIGKEASKKATEQLFKYPIKLEYEKVYFPLLLLSKKRYIGNLYSENETTPDYLDNKGVVLKRRDNFELLRETYQVMIDILMKEGKKGIEEVVKNIKIVIQDILNDKINIDKVVIVKTLKGPYKSQNIPHVVLSKILAERDPNNAPRSNDRIPYVFIDNGWVKSTTPQYTKVEDPEYAKANKLQLDKEYYINYLQNPLCEILDLFMKDSELLFKEPVKKYKTERLLRIKNSKKPQQNFFSVS
jgi:DNA polymerase elongation subunit (family B)